MTKQNLNLKTLVNTLANGKQANQYFLEHKEFSDLGQVATPAQSKEEALYSIGGSVRTTIDRTSALYTFAEMPTMLSTSASFNTPEKESQVTSELLAEWLLLNNNDGTPSLLDLQDGEIADVTSGVINGDIVHFSYLVERHNYTGYCDMIVYLVDPITHEHYEPYAESEYNEYIGKTHLFSAYVPLSGQGIMVKHLEPFTEDNMRYGSESGHIYSYSQLMDAYEDAITAYNIMDTVVTTASVCGNVDSATIVAIKDQYAGVGGQFSEYVLGRLTNGMSSISTLGIVSIVTDIYKTLSKANGSESTGYQYKGQYFIFVNALQLSFDKVIQTLSSVVSTVLMFCGKVGLIIGGLLSAVNSFMTEFQSQTGFSLNWELPEDFDDITKVIACPIYQQDITIRGTPTPIENILREFGICCVDCKAYFLYYFVDSYDFTDDSVVHVQAFPALRLPEVSFEAWEHRDSKDVGIAVRYREAGAASAYTEAHIIVGTTKDSGKPFNDGNGFYPTNSSAEIYEAIAEFCWYLSSVDWKDLSANESDVKYTSCIAIAKFRLCYDLFVQDVWNGRSGTDFAKCLINGRISKMHSDHSALSIPLTKSTSQTPSATAYCPVSYICDENYVKNNDLIYLFIWSLFATGSTYYIFREQDCIDDEGYYYLGANTGWSQDWLSFLGNNWIPTPSGRFNLLQNVDKSYPVLLQVNELTTALPFYWDTIFNDAYYPGCFNIEIFLKKFLTDPEYSNVEDSHYSPGLSFWNDGPQRFRIMRAFPGCTTFGGTIFPPRISKTMVKRAAVISTAIVAAGAAAMIIGRTIAKSIATRRIAAAEERFQTAEKAYAADKSKANARELNKANRYLQRSYKLGGKTGLTGYGRRSVSSTPVSKDLYTNSEENVYSYEESSPGIYSSGVSQSELISGTSGNDSTTHDNGVLIQQVLSTLKL